MAKKRNEGRRQDTLQGGELGRMNDALTKKCNLIAKKLHEIEGRDVPARYDLARDFREVRDNAKYGDNAVGKLAGYVGRSESLIYLYIKVVDVWPDKKEFLERAKQHDDNTKVLDWSHWMALAKVEDGRQRNRLARLAKREGWKAAERELKGRDGGSQSNDKADGTKPNAKASRPLQAATQDVLAQVDTLKGGSARVVKDLPAKITKAKPAEIDSAANELRRARKDLGKLCDALDECIGQLEKRQKLEAKKQAKGKNRKAAAGSAAPTTSRKRRPAA